MLSTDSEQEGKLKDDRPYFREGRAHPFVQSVYYSLALGRPTMTMATPILDASGRPIGVLVERVNLGKLDQVMAERTGLGTTGETFLGNRFNFFVSEVRGRDRLPEQAAVFTQGVKAALRGENGTALYPNHRGIPVVGAYRWLPGVSLALVAEIEQAEAFAPVVGLRRTLLGMGLLLIAAVLLVAPRLSRAVTRPVDALVAGARALGAGDLGHRIPVGGPEELAFLAQAFNRMAEALEEGREELEQANVGLEVKVQERTAELAALHSLAVAVSRSLDLGGILEVAADAVLAAFGAEGCVIRAVDPGTGDLVALAARGVSGGFLADRLRLPREDPVPALLLHLREPLVIADLSGDPRGAMLRVTEEGYRSLATVALRSKDRVVGTLSVFARAPARFTARHGRLLAAMGTELATAMEKAELFQQVQADAEFRKAAAELALTLGSTLKVDEVLSLTCSETARLFQVGGSHLWQVDEEEGELVGAAAHGYKAEAFLGLRVPVAAPDSVSAAAAREGRPQVVHDVPASGIAHAFLAKTFDSGSVLAVPLRVREKVTGVLVLNDLRPSRRFSPADVHGAEVIAGQAALAIKNAQLYEEANRKAERLAAMATVARTLTASLEERAVYECIVRAAMDLLGGDMARLWVHDEERGLLRVAAGAGAPDFPFPPRDTFAPGEGLVGTVFAERTLRVLVDPEREPLYAQQAWAAAAGVRATAAVPVLMGERALGVLSVVFRKPPHLGVEELNLLTSFAHQAAVAMENARLFAASERAAREARSLYAVARSLTTSLEPTEVLDLISVKTTELLGTPHAQVVLWDEATQTLRLGAAHGTEVAKVARQEFRLGEGVNGIVAQTRAPLVVNDYQAFPHRVPGLTELVAVIGVPLLYRDRLLGVLTSHATEPGWTFTQDHLALLTAFADQAAVAIENARLYRQILAHAEALEQRVIERTRQLEAASRHKSEFLAHMSHE
ncbi:MAG: GAF domain-containing protein, partial [candidate division NC10 bacterium]|nr:GAF domain-containing protein [candidate division NC10 bacterium]